MTTLDFLVRKDPLGRATLFIAPAQVKKRNSDWGVDQLGQRLLQDW